MATTLYVYESDDAANDAGATGTYYTNIQDAVNAATSGDTIEIAAGTYAGDVTLQKDVVGVSKKLKFLGVGDVIITGKVTISKTGTPQWDHNVDFENITFQQVNEGGVVIGRGQPTLFSTFTYCDFVGAGLHANVLSIPSGANGAGSKYKNCTFSNSILTTYGNEEFDECTFNNASINDPSGSLSVKNSTFNVEFTNDMVEKDFYMVRGNVSDNNRNIESCTFNFNNPENLTPEEGKTWTAVWARAKNTGALNLSDCEITGADENVDVFCDAEGTAGNTSSINATGLTANVDLADAAKGVANVTIENINEDGTTDIIITDKTGESLLVGSVDDQGQLTIIAEKSQGENFAALAADYANKATGNPVYVLSEKGIMTGYGTLAEAAAAASAGEKIIVSSDNTAPIAASVKFNSGETVITGNAVFDWSSGWFYVGDAADGEPVTVTFRNAEIAAAHPDGKKEGKYISTGFNIRQPKIDNEVRKGSYGVLNIDDSMIVTNYFQNSNIVNVYGNDKNLTDDAEITYGYGESGEANLSSTHGFWVQGRAENETVTGEDETAELNLHDGAYVKIAYQDGMGVGFSEGNGIVLIDNSKLEFVGNSNALNIGTKGTVKMQGKSVLEVNDRVINNGIITISGESTINGGIEDEVVKAAAFSGDGWVYMKNAKLDSNTNITGANVRFTHGHDNVIAGATINLTANGGSGRFQVGGGYKMTDLKNREDFDYENGVTVTVKDGAKIGSIDSSASPYGAWVGSEYPGGFNKEEFMNDAQYTLDIKESVVRLGYLHVSNDGIFKVSGAALDTSKEAVGLDYDLHLGIFNVNGQAAISGVTAKINNLNIANDYSISSGSDAPKLVIGDKDAVRTTVYFATTSNTYFRVHEYGVLKFINTTAWVTNNKDTSIAENATVSFVNSIFNADTTIKNAGTISVDAASFINAKAISGAGTITIDATNFAGGAKTIVDVESATEFTGEIEVTGKDGVYVLRGNDGDIILSNVDKSTLYVNAAWADADPETEGIQNYAFGDKVAEGKYYGINAFATIANTVGTSATEIVLLDAAYGSAADITSARVDFSNFDGSLTVSGNMGTNETIFAELNDDLSAENAPAKNLIFKNGEMAVSKLKADSNAVIEIDNAKIHTVYKDAAGQDKGLLYAKNTGIINIRNGAKVFNCKASVMDGGTINVYDSTFTSGPGDGLSMNGSYGGANAVYTSINAYRSEVNILGHDGGGTKIENNAWVNVYENSTLTLDYGLTIGGNGSVQAGIKSENSKIVLESDIAISANGLLSLNNSELIGNAKTITNNGTFTANNAVINVKDFFHNGKTATFTNVDLTVSGEFNNEPDSSNGGTYAIVGGTSKIQITNNTSGTSYALRLADDTVLKGGTSIVGSTTVRAQGDITFGETATDIVHLDSFDTRDGYTNDWASTKTITVNGTLEIASEGKYYPTYWLGIFGSKNADDATVATILTGAGSINSNTTAIFQYGNIVINEDLTINVNDVTDAHLRFTLANVTIDGTIAKKGIDFAAMTAANVTVNGNLELAGGFTLGYAEDVDVDDSSAKLFVNGKFSAGGDVEILDGSSITLSNGSTFTAAGVSGDGEIFFDGATLDENTKIDGRTFTGNVEFVEETENTISGSEINLSEAETAVLGTLDINSKADVKFGDTGVLADITLDDAKLTIAGGELNAAITVTGDADLTITDDFKLGSGSSITLTNGDLDLTSKALTYKYAGGTLSMDYASTVTFSNKDFRGEKNTLTVDTTGYTKDAGIVKLFDYGGEEDLADNYYQDLLGSQWNEDYIVYDDDLYYTTIEVTDLYLNAGWAEQGYEFGDEISKGSGKYYNYNAFSDLSSALKSLSANGTIYVETDITGSWLSQEWGGTNTFAGPINFQKADGVESVVINATEGVDTEEDGSYSYRFAHDFKIGQGVTLRLIDDGRSDKYDNFVSFAPAGDTLTITIDGEFIYSCGDFGAYTKVYDGDKHIGNNVDMTKTVIVKVNENGKMNSVGESNNTFYANTEVSVTGKGKDQYKTADLSDAQFITGTYTSFAGKVEFKKTFVTIYGTSSYAGKDEDVFPLPTDTFTGDKTFTAVDTTIYVVDGGSGAGIGSHGNAIGFNKETEFTNTDLYAGNVYINGNTFTLNGGSLNMQVSKWEDSLGSNRIDSNGDLTIANGATLTVNGGKITVCNLVNSGEFTMDINSQIVWSESLTVTDYKYITVDLSKYDQDKGAVKLFDFTGDNANAIDAEFYKGIIGTDIWTNSFYVGDGQTGELGDLYYNLENGTHTIDATDDYGEIPDGTELIVVNPDEDAVLDHADTNLAVNGIKAVVESGTFNDTISGGAITENGFTEANVITGDTDLTVDGGTFNKIVAGGDRLEDGYIYRDGASNLTINGGSFSMVVGGSIFAGKDVKSIITQKGNINLTINGGEISSDIYGGHVTGKGYGDCTKIQGNITVTIDAAVQLKDDRFIVAGSFEGGSVYGNTNVVFKGDAAEGGFLANTNTVWGGSTQDGYITKNGKRVFNSEVTGSRTITFDDFDGKINAAIRGFDTFQVLDGSDVTVAYENLSDITAWEFDADTTFVGAFGDIAGDNLIINGEIENGWTLGGFGKIEGMFNSVELDGVAATFDGSAWTAAGYKLEIEDNKTLKFSALT